MFSNKPKNKSRASSRFRKSTLLFAAVFVLVFVPISANVLAGRINVANAQQSASGTDPLAATTTSLPPGIPAGSISGGSYSSYGITYQLYKDPATGKYYQNNITSATSFGGGVKEITADDYNKGQQQVATQNKPGYIASTVYEGILRAFAWVCDLILWLFSWLVALGGFLLDIAFNIGTTLGFTKSQVVQIGWPIIRDLANMFFSLILLVISFATILRIESYGMKQILWRLVVAALLINFSLVIAGVVIDASNVMTRFFIKDNFQLNGSEATISSAILNSLQVTSFWKSDATQGNSNIGTTTQNASVSAAEPGSPGFGAIFLNVILGAVLMLVTAFVLLAAAFLFFIRMVVLWILLIFAPLAWLAMILPGTRSMWSKWWSEFMKWNIFPVVYGFFIYLTIAMISKGVLLNNPNITEATKQANATWGSQAGSIFQNGFSSSISIITNYVIMIIFLVAGLVFARSSGIAGASAMVNMGTSIRKTGTRALSRWQAGGAKLPGMEKLSNWVGPGRWSKSDNKFVRGLGKTLQAPMKTKQFIAQKTNREIWARAMATMKQRADEAAFNTPAASVVGMWENIKRAGSLGGKTIIADKNTAAEKEAKIKELQAQIEQKRINGEEGYEYDRIDQMLRDNGFDPADMNPAAQKARGDFMAAWDRQKAEEQYRTSYAKRDEKRTGPAQALKNIFSDENIHVENAKQALVSRRMQEYGRIRDEDTLVNHYMQAKDPKDKEALLRILASINGINTLFGSMGRKFDGMQLKKYIGEAFTPEDAARIAADISVTGAERGNMSFVGMTHFNPEKGRIEMTSDDQQEGLVLKKFRELDAQQAMIRLHPDSFRGYDEVGNRIQTRLGNALAKNLTSAHAEYFLRAQPRTKIEIQNILPLGILNEEFVDKLKTKGYISK
jgi:hypothetical protein